MQLERRLHCRLCVLLAWAGDFKSDVLHHVLRQVAPHRQLSAPEEDVLEAPHRRREYQRVAHLPSHRHQAEPYRARACVAGSPAFAAAHGGVVPEAAQAGCVHKRLAAHVGDLAPPAA